LLYVNILHKNDKIKYKSFYYLPTKVNYFK
jgi:hypothetical protein